MKMKLRFIVSVTICFCSLKTNAQTNTFPSSGNTGIGTTSPSALLHLYGSDPQLKIEASTNNAAFRMYSASGYYNYAQFFAGNVFKREIGWSDPSNNFYITRTQGQGNTNSDFVITGSGNVGIGAASPYGKLDLGNTADFKLYYYGNGGNTGYTCGIGLNLTNSINVINNVIGGSTSANSGAATWAVTRGDGTYPYSSYTDLFTIDSRTGNINSIGGANISGNVGIGTSSPSEKLSVSGNIFLTGLRSEIYGTDRNHMIVLRGRQNGVVINETNYYQYGDHVFNTGGAIDNQTEKLRITANGNIGIGTASPVVKLQVAGGDASVVGMNYTYTGAQARLWMGDNAGASGLNIAAEYDYGLKISLAGITNAFNIKQYTGNVGIGTTSPTEKLCVNGNIKAKKLIVTQTGWADHVFKPEYRLRSLNEVEEFIKGHQHLPEVPSQKEVEENGIDVGNTQAILLKKIEELTLYMINQNKKVEELTKRVKELETKNRK